MRILDRYLIRETIPPFVLALGIFTFLLAVRPMLDHASGLLAKGVPIHTVGALLVLLLPQALALTIPMAFLAGLLMALGRLSADRESVALLSCGVSPLRLLRPVLFMATVLAGLTLYVLIEAVPDCNQRYREIAYKLLIQQTQTDIKPRLFYEGFPGNVLYYREGLPDGGWSGIMLAETSDPTKVSIVLAREGHLDLDPVHKKVNIFLKDAVKYAQGAEEGIYDVSSAGDQRQSIEPTSVYGDSSISRGITEKSIAELREQIAMKQSLTPPLSPHQEIMAIHQKFSFPVACFVFALLGLALGLHTRSEGKLGGLALGMGVIFAYYGLMEMAESWTKGGVFPAVWARWFPNVVLGPIGVAAIWWRSGATGRRLPISFPGWLRAPFRRQKWASRKTGAPAYVLVVRLPALHLPRPRLLDLYLAGRYLRMLLLSFVGLMALYYIGTIIDLSDKVFKHTATPGMLLQYLGYSTPQFVYFVVPIAVLVAALGTIGGLTRTNELTVMRACGVSLYRAAAPLMLLALVGSALLFQLNEGFVARMERKRQMLEAVMKGQPPRSFGVENRHWLADPKDGRIYYYLAYQRKVELLRLTAFQTTNRPFRLANQTFAARAVYGPRGWTAEHGWVQTFLSNDRSTRENFATRLLPVCVDTVKQSSCIARIDSFNAADAETDLLTFGELRSYTKRLEASGLSITEQEVGLYSKIAFPLVTVVMTLIAVPFGVTTGRRGALYGIGLAVTLAVSYWLLSTIFQAAGNAGLLPPALAAWASNILFGAVALYSVLTVRT